MIDHLLYFDGNYDLEGFQITLPEDGEISTTALGAMVGDIPVTVLAVKIINQEAVYDLETGDLVSPAIDATGNWIVVRAQEEIPSWRSDPRLVTITDDELANKDAPFVIYKNNDFSWEAMQGRVFPIFAGSHYPFGPHMNISQLIDEGSN